MIACGGAAQVKQLLTEANATEFKSLSPNLQNMCFRNRQKYVYGAMVAAQVDSALSKE